MVISRGSHKGLHARRCFSIFVLLIILRMGVWLLKQRWKSEYEHFGRRWIFTWVDSTGHDENGADI